MSTPFVFETTNPVPGSRSLAHGHSGHSASLSLGSAAAFQAGQRESGSVSPAMFGQQQQPQQQQQPSMGQVTPGDSSAPSPVAGGPQREGQLRRGVCKFFNSQKGFGFVLDSKAEELGGQEGRLSYPLTYQHTFCVAQALLSYRTCSLRSLHRHPEQDWLPVPR